MRVIAVAAVLMCGVADVAAQTTDPRTIRARDGDLLVVTDADQVRVVRKRGAHARVVFDAANSRLVVLADYGRLGQPPDGRVDDWRRFDDVTPAWPFAARWEGPATLYEYTVLSPHSGPRWFGIETAEGLVQFGRREDLTPFGGAAPVATLMFNSGSGGQASAMTFDVAERQAFAGNMGGVGLSVTAPEAATVGTAPAVAPRTPQPVRVGGNISPPRKLHDVRPTYPDDALKARITGAVILETIIGVDGAVTSVKVLKGHPMLDRAAIDAVRQWRFEPTYLNGVAIPVIMTVITTFNLQ